MPAAFVKFNDFSEQLARGVHNFASHAFKLLLTNTAPNAATHTVKSDLTEISAGNGYSAGGLTLSVSVSESSGVTKILITDTTLTASGGPIGPFRYAAIYNDTAASDNLIGYYDRGSSITLDDTDSTNFDFDGTNGAITVT